MTRMIWQSFKECVFCKPEKRQYLRLTHICLTLLMSWRKNVKLTSAVTWKLWLFGFLGFPLMLVYKSSFFWDIYAPTACIYIAVSQHNKVYSRVLLTFCWSLRPPALGRQSRHSWTLPVSQLWGPGAPAARLCQQLCSAQPLHRPKGSLVPSGHCHPPGITKKGPRIWGCMCPCDMLLTHPAVAEPNSQCMLSRDDSHTTRAFCAQTHDKDKQGQKDMLEAVEDFAKPNP